MTRKKMFWKNYPTQASLRKNIQDIVNDQEFKEPFESNLISDLIVEKHYFCSTRNLRPKRFRKIPGYGSKGYSFEGDFTGLSEDYPITWHKVSWDKCIKPQISDWDRIVRAMRDRIEPIKRSHRDQYPFCEVCSIAPSDETHHSDPSFNFIALQVKELVSDDDISDALGSWNWFEKSDFTLVDEHIITVEFDRIHHNAVLQALCKDCHNKTKSG